MQMLTYIHCIFVSYEGIWTHPTTINMHLQRASRKILRLAKVLSQNTKKIGKGAVCFTLWFWRFHFRKPKSQMSPRIENLDDYGFSISHTFGFLKIKL